MYRNVNKLPGLCHHHHLHPPLIPTRQLKEVNKANAIRRRTKNERKTARSEECYKVNNVITIIRVNFMQKGALAHSHSFVHTIEFIFCAPFLRSTQNKNENCSSMSLTSLPSPTFHFISSSPYIPTHSYSFTHSLPVDREK